MRRQLATLATIPALLTIGLAAPAHAAAPLENRRTPVGVRGFSNGAAAWAGAARPIVSSAGMAARVASWRRMVPSWEDDVVVVSLGR